MIINNKYPFRHYRAMALTVIDFQSASDFLSYVDETIKEIRSSLGIYMKRVEEVRVRYEKAKKRYDAIKRLLDKDKKEMISDTKQIEAAGFRVLLNPTAEYEMSLIESVVSSLQEKLNAFEKTKDLLPFLQSDETRKISMVLDDGLPTGFMVYMEQQ